MSANIADALQAVVGTYNTAQQANTEYSSEAKKVAGQSDQLINQANQAAKDIVTATGKERDLQVQTAQQIANDNQRSEAINAATYGNQAMGTDVQKLTDNYHNAVQNYIRKQGSFANQFIMGFTGKDIASENLRAAGAALQGVTANLSELTQRASADNQLITKLRTDQNAPGVADAQSRINQADAYLTKYVPAIDQASKIKLRAQADVAEGADKSATEAKNMYMTLVSGQRQQRENENADLQRKLLELNIDEKTQMLDKLKQDNEFWKNLATRTGQDEQALRKLPEKQLMMLTNVDAGLPGVANLGDPAEVTMAKGIANVNRDPYQKITGFTLGDNILSFQQDRANKDQFKIANPKQPYLSARSANFDLVRDMHSDFLDNVQMTFPESNPVPDTLPNTLARWYSNPVGANSQPGKGSAFWNSAETQAYAQSGRPGAIIAQRVLSDIKNNPGVLEKDGINLNYLKATGASPAQAFDYYKYLQGRVIMSTPYQLYGMAPPQAKIPLSMTTQHVDVFGSVSPQVDRIIPQTPEDLQRAFIKLEAEQRAAKATADLAKLKISPEIGAPGSWKAN